MAIACAGLVVVAAALLYPLWSGAAKAQSAANPLADTTFPPPLSDKLSTEPSYAVSISDASGQTTDTATYSPSVISIPAGMTVIWSNNGADEHTVTTVKSSDYAPPAIIDSKMLAADGGSFMYTFTKPGVYRYTDLANPKASGIVDVGSAFQRGQNFNMLMGGMDRLGSSHGVTLRFVPKTFSIPPTTAVTYQVAVSGPAGKLFSKNFDDTDGILDLELVPQDTATSHGNSAQQFTTWGPDFAGQEGYGSTGTFHVQGPFMNPGSHYSVRVTALSKDNSPLNISDTFSVAASGK